jgi:DNA repair exonuclease SbcCD ATPase subunit
MATIAEKLESFSAEINDHKEKLIKLKGIKEQIENQIETEQKDLDDLVENQKLNSLASLFLLSETFERRQAQLLAIENIATSALRQVYGDEYSLKFDTFEEKRKDGGNNFKIEIKIISPHEGEDMETGLLGERGGGLIETVSFALRIAALKWLNYNGPILLDEAWKSMSTDNKIDEVASFLKDVSVQSDRQVILITHMLDKFGKIADNIVKINKVDGVATTQKIEYNIES